MSEHPILFSGEMVRAILEGRKTQTRRVITVPVSDAHAGRPHSPMVKHNGDWYKPHEWSPYGVPGDRLWVRETWAKPYVNCDAVFRADYKGAGILKWKPSIHMPRWASRITLDVVNVRVERVQDISEEDARAEGIDDGWLVREQFPEARIAYRYLWDSINAKRGYGWATNPWVWVIEFK